MKIETALLIIPPLDVQAFAAPLRSRFAESTFPLVPAHLTLMYPFVGIDEAPDAEQILRGCCSAIPPFEVELDRYNHFPRVLFLEPSNPDPIIHLYQCIAAGFPDCIAYGGAFGDDLHPHLTIAELAQDEDPGRLSLPPIPRLRFVVDRIYLYAGIAEDDRGGPIPFIPLSIIPLGAGHGIDAG